MNKRNQSNQHYYTREEFRKLDTAGKIMELAKNFDTPAGKNEDEVLEVLLRRVDKVQPVRKLRMYNYFRAAAAILILVLAFYGVNTVFSKEKITTGLAEQSEIVLPDKSEVILNADSKLTYSKRNFNDSRSLTLKGEAFFDVQKGGEFIITTPNGEVEILGTQLNVFSRGNEFWVSCLRGKVKVSSGNDEQIILPGEMVELEQHQLVKKVKIDVEHTVAWREGIFYFEDKPLNSIFEAIERQYNVSVQFDGNKNRLITVAFSNKNLEEALDVICIPMDLKYEIRNNKVHISEKPF